MKTLQFNRQHFAPALKVQSTKYTSLVHPQASSPLGVTLAKSYRGDKDALDILRKYKKYSFLTQRRYGIEIEGGLPHGYTNAFSQNIQPFIEKGWQSKEDGSVEIEWDGYEPRCKCEDGCQCESNDYCACQRYGCECDESEKICLCFQVLQNEKESLEIPQGYSHYPPTWRGRVHSAEECPCRDHCVCPNRDKLCKCYYTCSHEPYCVCEKHGCNCAENNDENYMPDMEFVSPILQGKKGLKDIKKVCDIFNWSDTQLVTNDTCGLHVHIDAKKLSVNAVKRLLVLYNGFRPLLEGIIDEYRFENYQYAENIPRYDLVRMFNIKASSVQNIYWPFDRYMAVNLQAYRSHGSIEFRQHHGTTDYNEIETWIHFLLGMVHLAEYDKTIDPDSHVIGKKKPLIADVLQGMWMPESTTRNLVSLAYKNVFDVDYSQE